MLKEGYIAIWRKLQQANPDAILIRVAIPSILSPSRELLKDYKDGKVDWNEYIDRFYKEMKKPECVKEMKRIKELAKTKDVYLMCYEKTYPCHRFLLIDMIKKQI